MAQVTVNPQALEPLQKPAPAHPTPTHPAPAHPVPRAHPAPHPVPRATSSKPPPAWSTSERPNPGGSASPPMGNLPPVPANPPAAIVLPPPIAVPTRPAPPPSAPPVTADAPGLATPLQGGLRITFGPGRSDLNPSTEATIRTLVSGGPDIAAAPVNASFTVTSFATGTPDDPSTARRLSLSRAIGVRSVLISQGVASVRIYVRALGPASPGFGDGPADRVDIVVGPPVMPTTAAATPDAKPDTKPTGTP